MFEALRSPVLRWMRVPHDPESPAGDPKSVRVFRASENFYKLRLFGWAFTQIFAVAGIVFWIWMLGLMQRNIDNTRQFLAGEAARKTAAAANPAVVPTPTPPATTTTVPPAAGDATPKAAGKRRTRSNRNAEQLVQHIPTWLFWPLRLLELFGIAGFLAQLPVTLAVLRLDYELRWYIVTDRSLRIRSGIWRVQELTMSFANIQQVAITRDPIQGLLKICDVRVQSAGGGAVDAKHRGDNLHTGIFHGVANAEEIRDLILERLRRFRAAGLGDPDDAHEPHVAPVPFAAGNAHPALDAARELLAETRALREQLQSA